jgi:hypothetical protein
MALRAAVYVAAVLTALFAPEPRVGDMTAAVVRVAAESEGGPFPSLIRLGLVTILLAGLLLEASRRKLPWR